MKEASTSKIEQLIDEIEEFIESCKPQPFSQSKVVVPKDELYELLTELRLKTPEEIKRYQKIIANREKIINDAQAQAEQMVEETNVYVNQLVEEHEIMLKAYDRAEGIVNNANAQAEATINAANEDAENIRRGALEYTSELIDNLQSIISNTMNIAKTNYDGILNGLSYNMDMLSSNKEAIVQQLQAPVETPAYEAPETPEVPEMPAVQKEAPSPAPQVQQPQPAPVQEVEDDDEYDDDDYDDID